MLELHEVESGYGAAKVLHGVSLRVAEGEVVTLMGRNGMGKTTTIRTIMGQLPHVGGETIFRGADLNGRPTPRVARLGIGLVPEGRQIFANLSVEENLLAAAANRFRTTDPWRLERIYALFPQLAARRHAMGNLLSGGEQQMLAIGRALMTNPQLLILDEATEGLAPVVRDLIWETLTRLKTLGQAILVVDKNITALSRIGDRHYVLEKGKIVWAGNSDALHDRIEHVREFLVA